MREIKFRAWDKIYRTMRPHDSFIEIMPDILKNKSEQYHIMQYTGLNDKNGKEIYEGDIAHIYLTGIASGAYITAEVKWNDGVFCWVADYFCVSIKEVVFNLRNTNVEVIGNIYENPELMEV